MNTQGRDYDGYSENYSVGVSSTENTRTSTTTGNITSIMAVSTGETSVTRYDPGRLTRIHLEWNLEDLNSCLEHCDDLTEDDLEWYAERARRHFLNALQKKQGGSHGENS